MFYVVVLLANAYNAAFTSLATGCFLVMVFVKAILDIKAFLHVSKKGDEDMPESTTNQNFSESDRQAMSPVGMAYPVKDKVAQSTHEVRATLMAVRAHIKECCEGFCRKHKSDNGPPTA